MPNRARDWFAQAERDLEPPRIAEGGAAGMGLFGRAAGGGHGTQSASSIFGTGSVGPRVARLLADLPAAPDDLRQKAKVLDNFYVATRYANGHAEGAPFEHYVPIQSDEAIR